MTSIASSKRSVASSCATQKPCELVAAIALADAEIEPPVRQQIEGRGLLGDQDRVVPRQHDDRGAEPDALGARREIASRFSDAETWPKPVKWCSTRNTLEKPSFSASTT